MTADYCVIDGFLRQNLVRGTPISVRDLVAVIQEDLDDIPRSEPVWSVLTAQGFAVIAPDDDTGVFRAEPRIDIALRVRLMDLAVKGIISYAHKGGEPEVMLL